MNILFPLIICFVSVSPALAQDAQSRTQTEERNKAAMVRFYQEVWDKGNVGVVDDVFAPTYQPHDTTVPDPMKPEAAEEQKKIAAEFRSYFSEFSFTPDFMLAEGDQVMARWTCRAKPKGLVGLLANERIEFSGINVFRCTKDRLGYFEREGSSYEWSYIMNNRSSDRISEKTTLMYDYENFSTCPSP